MKNCSFLTNEKGYKFCLFLSFFDVFSSSSSFLSYIVSKKKNEETYWQRVKKAATQTR